MPTINISQPHRKPLAEVRRIADEVALQLHKKYKVQATWVGHSRLNFKHSSLVGQLDISENLVCLELKPGFMLGAFCGAIETGVRDQLAAKLA